ncbi:hypothetical protein KRP22_007284 [Phytophthora ramorum]|nr:hypothetical protein KRP22_4705 [Phytophthora ramorum]
MGRSFPSRTSSNPTQPTALPRRRPLPTSNFDANAMDSEPWADMNARMPSPIVYPVLQGPVTPSTTDTKQLHSATSTSGDESSADDAKTAFKRQKTQLKTRSETKHLKPKRKERKPTHTLRKEQKMELLREIEQLQSKLESLKAQAIVSNALHVKKHTQAPVMNTILRDAVQSRQSTLADVQGLISGAIES